LAELQAYQQELRNQAAALAGHLRLGWINCGESGNDIICEEQMSKMAAHHSNSKDDEDLDGDQQSDLAKFDLTKLPTVLMYGRSICASLH
jgi:hypothetical protein